MTPRSQLSLETVPLVPWGAFIGRRRMSASPYIDSVWEGIARTSGSHLTAADGTIDLTFQKRRGVRRLLLSGPTSKARKTTFEHGDEVMTVRLRTGVHFLHQRAHSITDVEDYLPNAGQGRFWLYGSSVAFPDFDNVETFARHLADTNMLARDIVVEDVLMQRDRNMSLRTLQRHFQATTGLTLNHVRQIRRAEQARDLLASDLSLTSIAYETGYSNAGHMTHSFKYFFGCTPSNMRALIHKNLN